MGESEAVMSQRALSEDEFADYIVPEPPRSLSSPSGYVQGSYQRYIEDQLHGKYLRQSLTRFSATPRDKDG